MHKRYDQIDTYTYKRTQRLTVEPFIVVLFMLVIGHGCSQPDGLSLSRSLSRFLHVYSLVFYYTIDLVDVIETL